MPVTPKPAAPIAENLNIPPSQPSPVDASHVTVGQEYAKFSGTWRIESRVDDGIEASPEQLKDIRVVISGDEYSVYVGDDVVMDKWVWRRNSTHVPTTYDIQIPDGPDKGKTIYGICDIDGNTSRYCDVVGTNSSMRPQEFSAPAGSGRRFFVYKRIAE